MGRAACGKSSRTCGHGGGSPVLRGCAISFFSDVRHFLPDHLRNICFIPPLPLDKKMLASKYFGYICSETAFSDVNKETAFSDVNNDQP